MYLERRTNRSAETHRCHTLYAHRMEVRMHVLLTQIGLAAEHTKGHQVFIRQLASWYCDTQQKQQCSPQTCGLSTKPAPQAEGTSLSLPKNCSTYCINISSPCVYVTDVVSDYSSCQQLCTFRYIHVLVGMVPRNVPPTFFQGAKLSWIGLRLQFCRNNFRGS